MYQSALGQALMNIGSTLPGQIQDRQKTAAQLAIEQQQQDRLKQDQQNALIEFAQKQEDRRQKQAELSDQQNQGQASLGALSDYLGNRKSADILGQINLGNGQTNTPIPSDTVDNQIALSDQVKKYGSDQGDQSALDALAQTPEPQIGASSQVNIPAQDSTVMTQDKTAAQQNNRMLGSLGGYRLGQNTPVDLALDSSQKLADKEQADIASKRALDAAALERAATLNETKRHNIATEGKDRGSATTAGGNTYGLSQEENAALNNALVNGLDPYKINSKTAKIYAQQELINPGRKWNELGAQASFERSNNTMNTKALLNSINPLFDGLLANGKALGNSDIPLVNYGVNAFKEATGDPKIVQFNNQRDDLIAEIERGLLGSGVLSDSKYQRALKNVNSAQSFPQLQAAVRSMKLVIDSRLHALGQGPNPEAGQYIPKEETQAPHVMDDGATKLKATKRYNPATGQLETIGQ